MNIILVGFMGTGKTVVGKELAKILKTRFIDVDDLIEQKEGRKISRIFKEDGEEYFRNCEYKMIKRV
ncbi:MAG: AAA family ATPase, partial [Candidatus Omnitrophica bacterium]|nr:AAA family ATPase [Candidatus Omnitrophota bacterium]